MKFEPGGELGVEPRMYRPLVPLVLTCGLSVTLVTAGGLGSSALFSVPLAVVAAIWSGYPSFMGSVRFMILAAGSVALMAPAASGLVLLAGALAIGIDGKRALHPAVLLSGAIGFYVAVGGSDLSSYRGVISSELLQDIVVVLYALPLGATFLPTNFRSGSLPTPPRLAPGIKWVLILPAMAGGLLIAARFGFLLLAPSSRFELPPIAVLLAEVSLGALVLILLDGIRRGWSSATVGQAIAMFLILGSTGYRGLIGLGLLVALLMFVGYRDERIPWGRVAALGGALALLFAAASELRRDGSGSGLSSVEASATRYDAEHLPSVVREVHFALRESLALSARLLDAGAPRLEESILLADLRTVLPGEQVSGGSMIAELFGRSQSGGLTPGFVGAAVVDLGFLGAVFFALCLGVGAAWLWRLAERRSGVYGVYVLYIVELLHLVHRGVPKLAYVLVPASVALILTLNRWVRVEDRRDLSLAGDQS